MLDNLNHVVNALPPAADAFSGTVSTDVINMKNYGSACFVVQFGAGAVGTATISIEACSDVTPTLTTAIPFFYQACVSGDTYGAITQATAAGFTTAAAANKVYKIFVTDESLALSGYNYVRLTSVEVVNDPIAGGVVAVLTDGRFESEIPDTVLV
ncbi:hypothetical protein [Desulfosporosinus sp. Sb-LF]|uniref:hypothetical protein n=1 Tax=Desulfosporosinus sp. Sb-LF TaxID=2560027 RepID=UPI00107F330F|nr:hypothetical protein [Desulfosporosinus sp. Sb-LF]TGE33330.1 hypothetical protein E4K68_07500 [Desulfosporosinus sp. Sb-LF]